MDIANIINKKIPHKTVFFIYSGRGERIVIPTTYEYMWRAPFACGSNLQSFDCMFQIHKPQHTKNKWPPFSDHLFLVVGVAGFEPAQA